MYFLYLDKRFLKGSEAYTIFQALKYGVEKFQLNFNYSWFGRYQGSDLSSWP